MVLIYIVMSHFVFLRLYWAGYTPPSVHFTCNHQHLPSRLSTCTEYTKAMSKEGKIPNCSIWVRPGGDFFFGGERYVRECPPVTAIVGY
jgi:hypothetical protein